jgi:hypothetical protein
MCYISVKLLDLIYWNFIASKQRET